ncbi:MAG: hypothetical protein KBG68_09140 [Prevotella sp.]|nr:hypothetical protein [Prevotella sp.]
MKHVVLILMLSVFVGFCPAQNSHMKFKGIPMDGTLQSFTNKLKDIGFSSLGIQDGVSLLTGDFGGYKKCTIGAVADRNGMICKVTVIFPAMEKWSELEECYNMYKSMLSEKYDKPYYCEEKFQSNNANDDNTKKHELVMNRCNYVSLFSGDNGEIELRILHQTTECSVVLAYYDNTNQEKLKQQIMDDL